MKNLTVFIVCLLVLGFTFTAAKAQLLELTAFSGYTFPEKFIVEGGDVRISGGHTYGGILTLNLRKLYGVEFIYSRQDADADVYGLFLEARNIPVSVNYIQVGGIRYFPLPAGIKLFAGLNLGTAGLVPKERYDEGWKFAVGAKGGVKYYFTDRLGIRAQANLQMPIQFAGTSFFVGTGGSGVSVDSFSTIFQFSFTGGLVFKLL